MIIDYCQPDLIIRSGHASTSYLFEQAAIHTAFGGSQPEGSMLLVSRIVDQTHDVDPQASVIG